MLDYEIIDQSNFTVPTLNTPLNKNTSIINKKSIVLPLGEVKITRKVNSLLVIFRSNTKVNIWDQNKKRIFDQPKKEYTLRSLNSLKNSLINAKNKFKNINIKIIIIDDGSDDAILNKINQLFKTTNLNYKVENLNKEEFKEFIEEKKDNDTFSNLSSLLKCFWVAKKQSEDLILFVEDDYIHKNNMIEEMLMTYERLSSQFNNEIFLCPSDYPFFYNAGVKTNVLIGSHRHWQIINKTLCTFLTSKIILDKYWDNFLQNCKKRHDPFEKHINSIYLKEYCFAPIPTLSVHFTNINSSYGISPHTDLKELWEKNEI